MQRIAAWVEAGIYGEDLWGTAAPCLFKLLHRARTHEDVTTAPAPHLSAGGDSAGPFWQTWKDKRSVQGARGEGILESDVRFSLRSLQSTSLLEHACERAYARHTCACAHISQNQASSAHAKCLHWRGAACAATVHRRATAQTHALF
jgi:hypothetical protein